jgi:hypothetical protein
MCAHHEKAEGGYHMKAVAACILVMGISLAVIVMLWIWFGHIGPNFSSDVLHNQQVQLRKQYGFAPLPEISANEANTPPSLRSIH